MTKNYYVTQIVECARCDGDGAVQLTVDTDTPCPECEGNGCIVSQVNLVDILPDLLLQHFQNTLDVERQKIATALSAQYDPEHLRAAAPEMFEKLEQAAEALSHAQGEWSSVDAAHAPLWTHELKTAERDILDLIARVISPSAEVRA